MPIKQYVLWVGGILLCMMFAFDVYLPKAVPRPDYDFDRGGLKIAAPDSGIAPDINGAAVSSGSVQDHAGDPPDPPKDDVQPAAARAFAKLKPSPPRKHQARRTVRQQSVAAADRPAAPDPWSWHSDWSSNWTLRGPVSDGVRSNARTRVTTSRAEVRSGGSVKRNSSPAAAGRNPSCWFC